MSVIELNSNFYESYADVVEADIYFAAAFHASSWSSLTEEAKKQLLITASRTLDRQCWAGSRTQSSGQVLQWPRTATGIAGVENDIIPEDIVQGAMELALALNDGSAAQSSVNPGAQNIESLKAGSVGLTYFRPGPENAYAQTSRFPTIVQELVGRYLCGGAASSIVGVAFGASSGTNPGNTSVTEDDFGYSEGI